MESLTAKWRSFSTDKRAVFDTEALAELKKIAAATDAAKKEVE